jgi:hypothetical protein
VDDIAALILPHAGDDDWTRWDGRWAPWRPGHEQPPVPPDNVTEFGAYGHDVEVQVFFVHAMHTSPPMLGNQCNRCPEPQIAYLRLARAPLCTCAVLGSA